MVEEMKEKVIYLSEICSGMNELLEKGLREGINKKILKNEEVCDASLTILNALVTVNIKIMCEINNENELKVTSLFIDRLLRVSK